MEKDPAEVEFKVRGYKLTFTPMKMVGWYDATQLINTGAKAFISSVFGNYADKREIQACLNNEDDHDYSDKKEVWFDYLADLGDGFDSTYTLARLLAKEELTIKDKASDKIIPRGDLLIMGGDQVYPVASRQGYLNRLTGPYNIAFPLNQNDPKAPHLYAIPGNHDWYDGLTNFLKIFCQRRSFGNWRTQQHRSYFAIKLSSNVWLWGIDIQLDADIDKPQLDYFNTISSKMKPEDKVILCTAEPSWVYTKNPKDLSYKNLEYFEKEYIVKKGFKLILSLAGDLHHYSRYSMEDEDTVLHKITSGGGGAFLHPTHNLPEKLDKLREGSFDFKQAYPSKAESRRLILRNLIFPVTNWKFGFFMSGIYLLFAWILQTSTRNNDTTFLESLATNRPGFENIIWFYKQIISVIVFSPFLVVIIGVIVAGLYAFADKNSKHKNWAKLFGLLHGISHLVINLLMLWVFSYINLQLFNIGLQQKEPLYNMFKGAGLLSLEMFLIGGGVGSMIMGIYLIASNLLLGTHDNEAFSSLAWKDNKNFLRFHLTSKELTIYPIGIPKVTRWKKNGNYFEGTDAIPELIEEPIKIKL